VYSDLVSNDCVIICLYIDDTLIFGKNTDIVNNTKDFLSMKFEMKDIVKVDAILGFKIKRIQDGISLKQSRYKGIQMKREITIDARQ